MSKVYGGRVSDKAIFDQSGLIEKFIPDQDAIMADKGFLIEIECDLHNIKFIRLPFLKNKSINKKIKFSKEKANYNIVIASARFYIEKATKNSKSDNSNNLFI